MGAIGAAQAQEAVCQDAAFEVRVELVFDELRQASASSFLGLSEEALGMLLHQAGQRGLLGAVALVVDRGAITMRPPGLGGVGLHALGIGSLGWCSFSRRAAVGDVSRRYGSLSDLPLADLLELPGTVNEEADLEIMAVAKG